MFDEEDEIYQQLAAEFDEVFHDTRGGTPITYISGEQCISRLNKVLGIMGWSFNVLAHGINAEADEVWVEGRLEVRYEGDTTFRDQFGSQKIRRSKSSGLPVDIGFDLKGASTDALKKCAMNFGVGLYLSKRQPEKHGSANPANDRAYRCATCNTELERVRLNNGQFWTPQQLAAKGQQRFRRVLCPEHYRDADQAQRNVKARETEQAPAKPSEPLKDQSGTNTAPSESKASATTQESAEDLSKLLAKYSELETTAKQMALQDVEPVNIKWSPEDVKKRGKSLGDRIRAVREYDKVFQEAVKAGLEDDTERLIIQETTENVIARTAKLRDGLQKAAASGAA